MIRETYACIMAITATCIAVFALTLSATDPNVASLLFAAALPIGVAALIVGE